MGAIASQITSLTIVYPTVYSDADQRKHQGSASLAFVLGIHRGPVNSPHKWPVMRKMFPFDDLIMKTSNQILHNLSTMSERFMPIWTWKYSFQLIRWEWMDDDQQITEKPCLSTLKLRKMTSFLKMTCSNCSITNVAFWCKYQWSFFLTVSIGSDKGMAPNRKQAIIWTNNDLVCWYINVSLSFSAL